MIDKEIIKEEKRKKELGTKLPDEEVILKISACPTCEGIVRVAAKHMLDIKRKNEFLKEVMEYNLVVKEMSLIDYRKENPKFCDCKSENIDEEE